MPAGKQLVVLTLGGTAISPGRLNFDCLPEDVFLVVPGSSDRIRRSGRTLRLPGRCGIYHPDLIRAADAVIGKAGYSTLAEIYQADVPFGCVSRPLFREAPVLEAFAREKMRSVKVPEAALRDGSWTALIPALTALMPSGARRGNGASRVAAFIAGILGQ